MHSKHSNFDQIFPVLEFSRIERVECHMIFFLTKKTFRTLQLAIHLHFIKLTVSFSLI